MSHIINPATNRKVLRDGRIGRAILADNKSRSPSRRSRKSKSPRRKYYPTAKIEPDRGECHGRQKKVCPTDPNCSWRKRTGCVRKRGAGKSPVYEGPIGRW